MPNLTDAACKTTKPRANGDVLLGDGNGLYLRIRPGGTRVWVGDYLVRGTRRKINIGNYDPKGGKSENVDGLLDGGRLSLAQARFVADIWKELRRRGCDPAADREATKATAEAAQAVQAAQPTIREVVARFMAQHIDGKKSAAAVHYRLGRLAQKRRPGRTGPLRSCRGVTCPYRPCRPCHHPCHHPCRRQHRPCRP
jgi:hypothetical protein